MEFISVVPAPQVAAALGLDLRLGNGLPPAVKFGGGSSAGRENDPLLPAQCGTNKDVDPGCPSKKSWILLVEDNPADALLVREALKENEVNGELTVVADGEKAIEFLADIEGGRQRCPDLIILDLNLPRRSGREVLEYIRGSMTCGQVPVVILSSSDRQKDRDETASLGATRYLRKPSRLEEFIGLGAIFKQIVGGTPR